MPMPHDPGTAIFGLVVSMDQEQAGELSLNGLLDQIPGTRPQNFCQRVTGKPPVD